MTEVLQKARDFVQEAEGLREVVMLAPVARCVLTVSSGVGSSVAGVTGKESVPDDLEVERETTVEVNGVVAREEVTLVCLWERISGLKGGAAR